MAYRVRVRRRIALRTARRRLVRALLGLGCGVLALVSPARGEPVEGPCTEDAARICADAGGTRVGTLRCLKEHAEELSEACRALVAEPQQRRSEAGEACGEDAVRLCPGVQPGRHNTGMLSCLRANADSLSDACRNALDALPGKKREGAPPGA